MMVFVGSWNEASSAGAWADSKVTFAAESKNAVVFRFGGLVQPDGEKMLFAKLLLTLLSILSPSAGSPRQLSQPLWCWHPVASPCPRFAFLCSSYSAASPFFPVLQVELEWPLVTL